MNDDIGDIAAYYGSDPDREDGRLVKHQLEHDLTWRYLDRYLPAQGKLLEIGAATGRYTLQLARRGYQVTAVDLSAAQLAICRRRAVAAGLEDRVLPLVTDARDLGGIAERAYDGALIMGPLYHLVDESDRKSALREVYNHMRAGAPIFTAFISRFGIMGDLIKELPEWIEKRDEVRSILSYGRDPDGAPPDGFRGYFARVEELAPLHEAAGFETLVVAGVEPGISADDESYNRLEGEQRRLWLDLLAEISTEPALMGASRHLIFVGKKP